MHRYKGGTSLLLTGLSVILFVMFTWWRDVIREALYEDKHSERVQNGIRLGIALFILSEVMLFFSFFWAFFHSSTSPAFNLGNSWPPGGVDGLYHLGMPLSNSLILLSSAACVTWAHESFSLRDKKGSLYGLFSGISFAIIFTGFQMYEYKTAVFCISDGIFGSCFYMTTGFHGFHVIVGTIALVVSMFRVGFNHFTDTQHIGLESSIWYWHFVDYVWLLLYLSIYWWGCDPSKN
jgi:cytochrome c oxidase subunit 3